MERENKYSSLVFSCLGHINLLGFGYEVGQEKFRGNLKKTIIRWFENNALVKFIKITFAAVKKVLKSISVIFLRNYGLSALSTIVCLIPLNMAYNRIVEYVDVLKWLKAYWVLKRFLITLHFRNSFKESSDMFEKIIKMIVDEGNWFWNNYFRW